MAAAMVAYLGYAFATQGWMMYVVSLSTFIFALSYPAMNAIASQHTPANAQGSCRARRPVSTSLSSILRPPLMTRRCSPASRAPPRAVHFPGASFRQPR